jgi:hypothetical protein
VRALLLISLVLSAWSGGCRSSEPPEQPCQPGNAGPPVTTDHALPHAYASCDQACWELENLAPPGGGMPAGAHLVSCTFLQNPPGVRCVVQHERVCLVPGAVY